MVGALELMNWNVVRGQVAAGVIVKGVASAEANVEEMFPARALRVSLSGGEVP